MSRANDAIEVLSARDVNAEIRATLDTLSAQEMKVWAMPLIRALQECMEVLNARNKEFAEASREIEKQLNEALEVKDTPVIMPQQLASFRQEVDKQYQIPREQLQTLKKNVEEIQMAIKTTRAAACVVQQAQESITVAGTFRPAAPEQQETIAQQNSNLELALLARRSPSPSRLGKE